MSSPPPPGRSGTRQGPSRSPRGARLRPGASIASSVEPFLTVTVQIPSHAPRARILRPASGVRVMQACRFLTFMESPFLHALVVELRLPAVQESFDRVPSPDPMARNHNLLDLPGGYLPFLLTALRPIFGSSHYLIACTSSSRMFAMLITSWIAKGPSISLR